MKQFFRPILKIGGKFLPPMSRPVKPYNFYLFSIFSFTSPILSSDLIVVTDFILFTIDSIFDEFSDNFDVLEVWEVFEVRGTSLLSSNELKIKIN